MRLNGKNFTIFSTDTIQTIASRIAAKLSTLPEWLVFSPPLPETKESLHDVTVVDLLTKIRGSSSLDLPRPPFHANVTIEEVTDVFIATNTLLENTPPIRLSLTLSSLNGKTYKDPEIIWRNRDAIIGRLSKKIMKNKDESRLLSQKAEKLETISSVSYTDIEVDKVQFTADFGPYDGTLFDLFNSAVPDKNVPYITCTISKPMYKVYRDFQMNPEWLTLRLNNVMLFKVNSEKFIRESGGINKYKRFTSAAMALTDNGRLVCTIDAVVGGERCVSKSTFLERVMLTLPHLKQPTLKDNLILSHFVFPSQCFDPVVFADMIMMNETLNKFVVIDEFARASRTTTNSSYIKRIDGKGASSLILKQTTYSGEYGFKRVGEWYVMCRMRTRDETEAIDMRLLLSKIISVYNDEYDSLVSEYKQELGALFVSNLCSGASSTKRVRKIKGLKGLRAIEPEIFYPTFTRKCTNPPIVVQNRDDTQNQVMLFPIKGEVGKDGVPITSRLYTCDTDNHKYIGLRDNDLSNKDIFPYVPCCFARDQFTRAGSGYRAYFFDENLEKKRVTIVEDPQIEEYHIIRKRTCDEEEILHGATFEEMASSSPGQLQSVPPTIEKFFQMLLMNPMKKVERCSGRYTKYSAIEAILFARGVIKYKRMRISTVNNRVGSEFQKLLNNLDAFALSAKQELYDISIQEIKQMLATQHISPSIFVRVLEILLDCNIFVFSNQGLVVPPHSRMYVKFKPSREIFFLYENLNGSSDIIGVRDTYGSAESFKMVFGPNEDITKHVFDVFRTMTLSYAGMKEIPVPKLSRMNITEQVIDSHGKCRVIIVDSKITLVPESPIPPFAAKSATRFPRTTIDSIINLKNCKIIERKVIGNTTREVVVYVGTVKMTVLTNDSTPSTIPISRDSPKYDHLEAESAVTTFKSSKRRASQLLQTTINFTIDLMKNGKTLDDSLRAYAATHGGLTDDNKHLLYACGQWIRTHPPGTSKLTNSVDLNTIIPTAFVLTGEESVQNLIHTYSFDYTRVFNEVNDTTVPYFFVFKHKIYLAVLSTSINDANEIIDAWLRTGRVRLADKIETKLSARIYSYDRLENDGDKAMGCKILVVDDKITVLLKLSSAI